MFKVLVLGLLDLGFRAYDFRVSVFRVKALGLLFRV